jgi:hypothetical protein
MPNTFRSLLNLRRKEYKKWGPVHSSALGEDISFTMRGFKHLRFHLNNQLRNSREIIHKMNLLPFVRTILENATEIESYRKIREIEYWSFIGTPNGSNRLVRVVVRRVGDGKIHFWSVMGLRT